MKQLFLSIWLSVAVACCAASAPLTESLGHYALPNGTLVDQVMRNCSITHDVEVVEGSFNRSWYTPSLLEKTIFACDLCGSLAHFFVPMLKNYAGGTFMLEVKGEAAHQSHLERLLHLASLYHEMGHIAHQNGRLDEKVNGRLFFNREVQEHQEKLRHIQKFVKSLGFGHVFKHVAGSALEDQVYTALLNRSDFKADLERIDEFRRVGSNFLMNVSSQLALAQILLPDLNAVLWDEPDCQMCRNKMIYKRGKEKRADLFAIDKLWHNDRLDVIIANIYLHGYLGYKAARSDIHPSGAERALFMIGFLVAHGVDVLAYMHQFEQSYLDEIKEKGAIYLFKQVVSELVNEHSEHENVGSSLL